MSMLTYFGISSIVFSTWKKSLELVARSLAAKNIPFVSVDGSISLKHRRKVLLDFQDKSDTTVLLMTLGTGSMG
jgi:SWI/SNF-related matrix-associated actin-dependent regulator of chromatin subfamily A3